MSAPPANPRRRQQQPCGQTCPNIVPAPRCVLPAGHHGLHEGGGVHWLRSVEREPMPKELHDELVPTGRVLKGPGR